MIVQMEIQGFGHLEVKNMSLKSTLMRTELCISCIDGLILMGSNIKLTVGSTKTKMRLKSKSGKMETDVSMKFIR